MPFPFGLLGDHGHAGGRSLSIQAAVTEIPYSLGLVNHRNLFLKVPEAGGSSKAPADSSSWFRVASFCWNFTWWEGRGSGVSRMRALIPSGGLHPHDLL